MNSNLQEIIREMREGRLFGNEREEKESILLQALRCSDDERTTIELCSALAVSGTILAVPCLFGLMKSRNVELKALLEHTISRIRDRARLRKSMLPEEYFSIEHWRSRWRGGPLRFLSYVSVLAEFTSADHDSDEEANRIGDILVTEMQVDISPFTSFKDFKVCTNNNGYQDDYKLVLDRMEQERIMNEMDDAGILESWNTILIDHLRDLQSDYLVTLLGLGNKFEYHRFVLKMAECLNDRG